MTTTNKKPPTQIAGVEGIAAIPIELTPAQPQQIDWARLCELPSFQMFAAEKEPALAKALSEIHNWIRSYEPEDLYKQYCDWHEVKGYWPNETPDGKLKVLEA